MGRVRAVTSRPASSTIRGVIRLPVACATPAPMYETSSELRCSRIPRSYRAWSTSSTPSKNSDRIVLYPLESNSIAAQMC